MLHIHRAVRADALADALAVLLSEGAADPFAPEVVAVPTRGMERWLTQRMSSVLGARPGRADGICANVEFPSPHRLVTEAVAAASGVDPAEDPWLPERSVWPLLTVVEESLGEPWLATLAAYLGAGTGPSDSMHAARHSRRLTTVRHLAGLFDRYSLHRPEMLAAWRREDDLDAMGAPLPPASAWQAELWRRLRARIGVADLAERAGAACSRIAADPGLVDLPLRLALFGLTRIPAGHLGILRALAAGRELHLFLLHPSPSLWEKVTHRTDRPPSARREDDGTVRLVANRLLASWGRDSREMQLLLTAGAEEVSDAHHKSPDAPDTLLGRIQQGVRDDRAAPGAPLPGAADARPPLATDDRSIQIHSCHGRARQVEVIRDAILHALVEDPTLEPRDVIVMCPDIETFAPLIQATFGAAETDEDDTIDLRVRLADRSLRQTNPVLGVVAQLLELAEQRLTASQLLDLADRGPVRRRFHLDDDDITRLADWISQAGIRWGLDAAHRAPYKLDALENGTWQAGLERLLLGVTMTEDGQRLFSGVLPLDDVDSRAIDLAGRFTELVARVGEAVRSLTARQPLAAWADAIAQAADALTATGSQDRWQRAELQRLLDDLVAETGDAAPPELAPAEVRALLARRLEGRPTRANFRTGHLTVCTLQPMRSVPHRVVCLLGLDDGAFPRKAPRDGDDLLLDSPQLGERDPRSEDRQLLLDALLAAGERLIVTFSGNDERTNAPRPPAVPVGELLDAVDATVTGEDGEPAREQVVIRHPLQPFDARNFVAGDIAGPRPWSFDGAALAGARALAGTRSEPRAFLSGPLSPRPAVVVELADLVRFVEHPVRAFMRQRLGISLYAAADEIEDELSVELDGLQRWGVGQRLLEARLRGIDERTAILAEIARGTLPPGVLGKPVIDDLSPIVTGIVERAQVVGSSPPGPGPPGPGPHRPGPHRPGPHRPDPHPPGVGGDPIDVRVALGDGRLLNGTVTGVTGDLLLATTFSRVSAKHRIAAWVRLLALTAAAPERPFAAATVGRGQGHGDVRTAQIQPLGATADERRAVSRAELAVLMDLYDRGMREPLPMFCQTSAAYAQAARQGQDGYGAALKEWETEWSFDREDREAEHQMAFGGVLTLSEVLDIAPGDGEAGEGWLEAEPSRFGRLARRLWEGLLAHEEVRAR